MFAGPFMNLILAVVIFLGVLMGFGVSDARPPASARSPSASSRRPQPRPTTCPKGDPVSPAEGRRPQGR